MAPRWAHFGMVNSACEKPSFCRTQSMLTGSMFFPAQDKKRTRGSSFQCLLRNWRILLASGFGAFSLSSFSVILSLWTREGGDIPRGMEPRNTKQNCVKNIHRMNFIVHISNNSLPNRSFHSCLLCYLVYECERGWRWPCFETDLSAFLAFECQLISIRTTKLTQQSEVFIKTRSPAASLPFNGQVTEYKTEKWFICR